jgi:hypothetical protein
MKRSEMITLLQESFIRHANNQDVPDDRDMWSLVLEDLENVGILPPLNSKLDWATAFSEVSLHEWEQE